MKTFFFSVLQFAFVVFIAISLMQCTRARVPLTKVEVPMVIVPLPELPVPFPKIPFLFSGEGDYRLLTWRKAFHRLCNQISREYPFTEWKNIDWKKLEDTYSEKVAEAQKQKDVEAFYLALREFLFSIPDAGVRIETNESLRKKYIGGGYGFAGILTEDKKYVVFYITPGSSADKAGMKVGAEIAEWNGAPVITALEKVSTLWADNPPATNEGKIWEKSKLLSRAPVGTKIQVTFVNPDTPDLPISTSLIAEEDNYATLLTPVLNVVNLGMMDSPVQSKIIDGKIGYIRIVSFASNVSTPFPAQAYQKIVTNFIREGVQGVIIDLRGNSGGDSSLAVKFGGHFVEEDVFFQQTAIYKKSKKEFILIPGKEEVIKPLPICYRGKVVVLVDYGTAGCAELLAKALSIQKRVTVMGFCSTKGSVGLSGGDIQMPRGITLSYPVARSLDKEGKIQVEADADGNGGVAPTHKVPLTSELIRKYAESEGEDFLLSLAVDYLLK